MVAPVGSSYAVTPGRAGCAPRAVRGEHVPRGYDGRDG